MSFVFTWTCWRRERGLMLIKWSVMRLVQVKFHPSNDSLSCQARTQEPRVESKVLKSEKQVERTLILIDRCPLLQGSNGPKVGCQRVINLLCKCTNAPRGEGSHVVRRTLKGKGKGQSLTGGKPRERNKAVGGQRERGRWDTSCRLIYNAGSLCHIGSERVKEVIIASSKSKTKCCPLSVRRQTDIATGEPVARSFEGTTLNWPILGSFDGTNKWPTTVTSALAFFASCRLTQVIQIKSIAMV